MRLVGARVSNFKSVSDSGEIRLDDDVTALVGKNESGKTAILQAMYRFKPLASGHATGFEELRDYPRRYRSRDRAKVPTVEPISLDFEIEPEDREAYEDKFGAGTLPQSKVTVSRRYGTDQTWWGPAGDDAALVREHIASAGLSVDKYTKSTYVETIRELEKSTAAAANELAGQLKDLDLPDKGRILLSARLPSFQYFDDYNILPGSVSIERLQTVPEDDLDASERTALSLLRLAGIDQEEFTETKYEPRKAALEAAANQLSDELFEYWTQNQDLSVELDIEFRPVDNRQAAEPWLQIRVRNNRHRVTLNMAERSKGFIWFFSFLAAFSEYADETRRVILLDEPGLNLHAKAQNDLLRFIDERLAPHHQVIYSTHSLFMIEPTKLGRCRTVEDVGDLGTKVSEDVWSARPDTVFPLLGALGVDMSQTLIIGGDQLLVEGPSEFAYLTVVGDMLRREGGRALDSRWTITPVGGIDKLPTFIALLGGSDLKLCVLMDGSAGGSQKLTNLINRGLLEESRLIPITDITGTNEADIEDLFDADWYLDVLKRSGGPKIAKSKLAHGRIVKQIEAISGAKFDHYQPASYLMRDKEDLPSKMSQVGKDRFQKLIDRINGLLT
jgi:predicted ATP-dependent endonuclease of OLD family